jgi:hypothetical protein
MHSKERGKKDSTPSVKVLACQVAHTCNPNYTRGRDQEDCDSKPARANSSRDPILKKIHHRKKKKKVLVEWLKVQGLSSSPNTTHTHTQTPGYGKGRQHRNESRKTRAKRKGRRKKVTLLDIYFVPGGL